MIARATWASPHRASLGLVVALLWAMPGTSDASQSSPTATPAARNSQAALDLRTELRAAVARREASLQQSGPAHRTATAQRTSPGQRPAIAPHAIAHATTNPPAPIAIAAGPVWTDHSGAWRQHGVASWYGGKRWQGKPTASGVRFNENDLTAAHASLPLGSRIRVTVAETGRTVVVTINDRPGTRTRIIDLSRAAAEALGIIERGLAKVSLTPT